VSPKYVPEVGAGSIPVGLQVEKVDACRLVPPPSDLIEKPRQGDLAGCRNDGLPEMPSPDSERPVPQSDVAVKGRAFGSPLARGLYPRASTAEVDPRAKPGAPAAVEERFAVEE